MGMLKRIRGSKDGYRRRKWGVIILAVCFIALFESKLAKRLLVGEYQSTTDEAGDFLEQPAIVNKDGSIARHFTRTASSSNRNKQRRTRSPVPQNITVTFQLPKQDRLITLVHVGKAGGLTIRSATSLICRLNPRKYDTPGKLQLCFERFLSPGNVLAKSVQYYFHMHAVNKAELAQSTSFLVMLRNPVDRVVSNFRYSHPVNCNKPAWKRRIAVRPWGCEVLDHLKNPFTADVRLYQQCFPTPQMEDLAQATMSPWHSSNNTHFQSLTLAQQRNCQWIARTFLQGTFRMLPSPHMYYNYYYYRNWTLTSYPDKEVFGIRTTHEWQDLKTLDVAMGGNGDFYREGRKMSHGSESFEPSPLSEQAYQKLCCVLEAEIHHYSVLVGAILNLNATEKQECLDEVRHKCGIATSWQEWRSNCKEHLARDEQELQEFQDEGHHQFIQQLKQQQQQPRPASPHEEMKKFHNQLKANG